MTATALQSILARLAAMDDRTLDHLDRYLGGESLKAGPFQFGPHKATSGREWRDRALEAEGLIYAQGALKDAAEIRAREVEEKHGLLDRLMLQWKVIESQREVSE